MQSARVNPGVDTIDQSTTVRQLDKGCERKAKRQEDHARRNPVHDLLAIARPQEEVEHHPEQGKEHNIAQVRDRLDGDFSRVWMFHLFGFQ